MNDGEQDQLLKQLLPGEAISSFREASLESALDSIRQRRRKQGARLRLSLILLPASLLALSAVLIRPWRSSEPVKISSHPPPSVIASASPVRSRLKIITDEELLALFPDRPRALIGTPGGKQVVLLGSPADSEP